MDTNEIKVGETFSKDGKKFEKTRDGNKDLATGEVSSAKKENVILETQILKG